MTWTRCKTENCGGIVSMTNRTKLCNKCLRENNWDLKIDKIQESSEKVRKYTLKKYQMNELEYESMFKGQDFMCAICKKGNHQIQRFCVDHCHKTGQIRGILCAACNKAIGLLRDSEESLLRAVEYLKRSRNRPKKTISRFREIARQRG